MLVIFVAVFAVLIQNGDSNCMQEFQSAMQACQNKIQDAANEASKMSSTDAQNKMCCAFDDFKTCAKDAGKKCGRTTEGLTDQALDAAKSMVKTPCSDYDCSGTSSLVPTNTGIVFLLLFLGYFLSKF